VRFISQNKISNRFFLQDLANQGMFFLMMIDYQVEIEPCTEKQIDNEGDVLQYSILSLSRIRIVKDRFFLFDFVNYNVLFNI
jgi:hypothetical protein